MTPALRRRVVPIASHIIATEELPPDLARSLIPKRRSISDTKRVLCYYRMSPDGTRMVFGGRARFTPADPRLCARVLHGYMTERFPQLKGVTGDPQLDRQHRLHPRRAAAYGRGGRAPLLPRAATAAGSR